MSQHNVILLLGSNLGNTKDNIEIALTEIEKDIGKIIKKSKFLTTEPIEFVSSNFFCNIAIVIATHYSPITLLKRIKEIERNMGRIKDSAVIGTYEDRIIDIDIVTFDCIIFEAKNLKIPHQKHILDRFFSIELLKNLGE
mgnify:CR=1 FL=1